MKPITTTFLISIFSTLCAQSSFASLFPQDIHVPKSHLKQSKTVPVEMVMIAKKAERIYGPLAQAMGGALDIGFEVENDAINAYAMRKDGKWLVRFLGGLVRNRKMNTDAFTAILCHEIGHHFGGAPLKRPGHPERGWSAAEGQADYYATNVCIKKLLSDEDNWQKINVDELPEVAIQGCRMNYSSQKEIGVCLRSALMSEKLGLAIHHFGGRRGRRNPTPKIETPELNGPMSTNRFYPSAQCRLDTLFQGGLCSEAYQGSSISNVNCEGYNVGAQLSGSRPRCWYAGN